VEQATQELARMSLGDVSLPPLEDDDTLVLAARAVLGKQARPVLPVGLHDHRAGSVHPEHLAAVPHSMQKACDVVDDSGETGVA
jgi:hypothetical protein